MNTFLHTLNVLGFLAIIFLVPGLLLGLLFNWLNKDDYNRPAMTKEEIEKLTQFNQEQALSAKWHNSHK
ncbi:hypothetical protein [Sulfuricurvum sp.]|uniref:hypothetical protein n=1 Tax=Sulfuricurvum sp. TaxID=2025608 RepID=UPI00261D1E79|nr:hypothetical protein [Sulfuricurvum sp.]MDD2782106.1 hypothetical protein [Sulfuricurvum sp.]